MKNTVYLEYAFIFTKDSNIWNHLYEFEKDLAAFFSAKGLECEQVSTLEGSTGKHLLMIRKATSAVETLVNPKGVNLTNSLPNPKPAKKEYINMHSAVRTSPFGKPIQKSSSMVNNLTEQMRHGLKGLRR
jgi:hypothetical protein